MRVALLSSSGELVAEQLGEGLEASRELELLITQLISKSGFEIGKITQIIIGSGPGSFTGLRIGFSFFKGLSYALGVPLRSVSSFAAVAHAYRQASSSIAVISDARRDQLFFAAYSFDRESKCESSIEPRILNISDLGGSFSALPGFPDKFKLCTLTPHFELLAGVKCAQIERNFAPQLGQLFLLQRHAEHSEEHIGPGELAKELAALTPFYLREVAAKTIAERKSTSVQ